MEIFSTDPERPGVFAVGQVAWGIFALGQLSCGVIAVGQLARGVIAIGQGAVGIVAIGQGALGVLYGGGMIAVAGRGFGICLKVLPKIEVKRFERPQLPPLSTVAELEKTGERGWVLAQIRDGELRIDGEAPTLELSEEARQQLRSGAGAEHNYACVTVVPERRVVEGESGYRQAAEQQTVLSARRMATWREAAPSIRLEGPMTGFFGMLVRLVGMVGLGAAWWLLAGMQIFAMFFK